MYVCDVDACLCSVYVQVCVEVTSRGAILQVISALFSETWWSLTGIRRSPHRLGWFTSEPAGSTVSLSPVLGLQHGWCVVPGDQTQVLQRVASTLSTESSPSRPVCLPPSSPFSFFSLCLLPSLPPLSFLIILSGPLFPACDGSSY